MPVLSWFYYCDLNESWRFIGTCDFTSREAFQKKVDALCVAHGWSNKAIKTVHHYVNSIRDDLTEW